MEGKGREGREGGRKEGRGEEEGRERMGSLIDHGAKLGKGRERESERRARGAGGNAREP
jgi:hypothetical protein